MNIKKSDDITRKEAIKRSGYLLGGVIFAPSILGVLNGCTPKRSADWDPEFFSDNEAKLVTALADVIMPKDDYPSASEVGVPSFIESMVSTVYNTEQRNLFMEGLNDFGFLADRFSGREFTESLDEDRYRFTYEQNQTALQHRNGSINEPSFLLMFKELTILGYFTSEAGATQVLRYEPTPGFYNGCMPFEEIGKTWATL